MAERLDRVTVRLSSNDITLPWATREALLTRLDTNGLGREDIADDLGRAFADVGAARPVTLTDEQKTYLLRLLEAWSLEHGGYDAMPAGLFVFRNALEQDLRGAAD